MITNQATAIVSRRRRSGVIVKSERSAEYHGQGRIRQDAD